jgi:hypothetical protein
MDGAASIRREYEQQQRENIIELESRKKKESSTLIAGGREKESQMEVSVGDQIETVKMQILKIDGQISEYENVLNNPDLPAGQRKKIQEALRNLRAHRAYLNMQLYRLRARLDSSKKMLWFHIKTRKEMVEEAIDQQKTLVYRRYAEIFARIANNEAIAKAQQQAQKNAGARMQAAQRQAGEQHPEAGRVAA